MKRKRISKQASFKKKLYKLSALMIFIVSSFFIKEVVIEKEEIQLPIGNVSGRVIKVNDGDTLTVFDEQNGRIKIRLYGIDAPELDQPGGEDSKRFLNEKIYGKEIVADILDIDRYKRFVARAYIDDIDINRIMVAEGQAWVYPQYCKISEYSDWKRLQKTAKNEKKGFWGGENPVQPWVWRQRR